MIQALPIVGALARNRLEVSTAEALSRRSGDWELPSRVRRPLDRINKAMQVNRDVERWQPALSRPDRLGEQRVHLPNVERISGGKVARDINETFWYGQVL